MTGSFLPSLAAAGMAALAAAAVAAPAPAQPVVVELRAGAAIGNYTLHESGLDILPKPSFGGIVEVWPTERLAGYASITRASFGCEEGLCTGRDVSVTSQGVVLGARWSPGLPWLRAGVALMTTDVDATGADPDDAIDPGIGLEVAGGLDIGIGERFRIRPGLTYLRHEATATVGEGHISLLALEVGVAVPVAEF